MSVRPRSKLYAIAEVGYCKETGWHDHTFEYGLELREQIGNPKTIFLTADHYTSVAYTQFIKIAPSESPITIFPFPYIEHEALEFYKRSFDRGHRDFRLLPLRILQLPLDVLAKIVSYF